ncbi:MAG: hypothetical protein IPI73_25885 [Betaproteobacteria bacterium]|nr:hypothetical protein [Betaproteobacteria bacterium]MBK8742733.1 hypothetical protein [Betaproteobacteria bacterium]
MLLKLRVRMKRGESIRQLTQSMGLSRNTVRRYLRGASAQRQDFGREEPEFSWEQTDKAALLREAAGLKGEAKRAVAAAE